MRLDELVEVGGCETDIAPEFDEGELPVGSEFLDGPL